MRALALITAMACLTGCSAFSGEGYPTLLPLDEILVETPPEPDTSAELSARADALRARADALRAEESTTAAP
ncbi:hypothetical protein [Thioclava atlantica]|uniref:Lipoprotein n=1 Tax=Thioclava atlantica TaxID=1317124 RepID=A0A085TTT9_9RHOB|nr:hypothetical protein [Thioclava atlantica]KFE34136.1 hypothetical protein DW2_14085 [Thioclava atlantica]